MTCGIDLLDILVSFLITQILTTTEMLQWGNKPLCWCRSTRAVGDCLWLSSGWAMLMLPIVQTHVVVRSLPVVVTRVQNLFQERDLLTLSLEDQVLHLVNTM
jgi:hypothetical protein